MEECGVDVNEYSDTHFTALHVALNEGNQDIAEYLISEGANVEAEDIDGKTPEKAPWILRVQHDLAEEAHTADKSNDVTRSSTKPPISTHKSKESSSNSLSESHPSQQSAIPTNTSNSAVRALEKEEDEGSHQMEHKFTKAEKEKRTRVEESNTLPAVPPSDDFIPLNFVPVQFSCPTSPALSVYEKIMDLEQKSRPSTKPLSPRDTGRSSRRPSTTASHFSPDIEDILNHSTLTQVNGPDSAAESFVVRNLDANSFSATPSATKVRNTGVMNMSGVRFEDEVEGESDDGLEREENRKSKEDKKNEITDPLLLGLISKTSSTTKKSAQGSGRSVPMIPLSANPKRKRLTVVAARWDTPESSNNNESDGMSSIMSGWTWSKTGLVEVKGPCERFSIEHATASRPVGDVHNKLDQESIKMDLKEESDEEEDEEIEIIEKEDAEESCNEDGSTVSDNTEGEENKSKDEIEKTRWNLIIHAPDTVSGDGMQHSQKRLA